MGYYSTEQLAAKHQMTPAATRWHLRAGGLSPRVTVHRTPRHHVVHSWGEDAAAYLIEKLRASRFTVPNPLRWIPFSVARARLGCSKAKLYRLIKQGKIRTRRALVKTTTGGRWYSYLCIADLATLPQEPSKKHKEDMPQTVISALRRAWLILLAEEEHHQLRHLAAYTENAPHIILMCPGGITHHLPLTAPETCPTLQTRCTAPPSAETWAELSEHLHQALAVQHAHPGSILSLAADSADIWSRETKENLAHLPLPAPC